MKEYSKEKVDEEIRKSMESQKTPNVLICGRTGAGKSSVINFLFKENVAMTSDGEPCTRDIQLYKGEAVNIYDSEGYEIGSEKQAHYQRLIFDDFLEKKENQKVGGVHIVWYTISAAGKRFTDTDISIIKKISECKRYPLGILLTKIDEVTEEQLASLSDSIQKEIPGAMIFKLSNVNDEAVQKFCDWKKLVDWTYNKLAKEYRYRFVSGLREGLAEKQKQARIAVALATAASAGVALSPIPFSDAALLIPIQTAMIFRISNLYGIGLGAGATASMLTSVGLTTAGRMAAGNLVKFIPVFGTAAGITANVIVASGFTAAIGIALTELCNKQAQDMLKGKPVTIDIEKILSSGDFLSAVRKRTESKEFEKEAEQLKNEGNNG